MVSKRKVRNGHEHQKTCLNVRAKIFLLVVHPFCRPQKGVRLNSPSCVVAGFGESWCAAAYARLIPESPRRHGGRGAVVFGCRLVAFPIDCACCNSALPHRTESCWRSVGQIETAGDRDNGVAICRRCSALRTVSESVIFL